MVPLQIPMGASEGDMDKVRELSPEGGWIRYHCLEVGLDCELLRRFTNAQGLCSNEGINFISLMLSQYGNP